MTNPMKQLAFRSLMVWILAQSSTAKAEDAAAFTPNPVKPGRPHASSFDPHGQLAPERLMAVAHQHMIEGRPQEALHTLTDAIGRYPDDAQLHAMRGSILLQQGRITPALQDLERALALNPDNAEVLTNRAQAYRRFERNAEARADLNRAIELNPDLIAARFNRGALRFVQGDLAGARKDFDYCIAIDPHLPAPYFNRAAVFDALGERPAAIQDIERFLQISTSDAWKQQAQQLLDVWQGRTPESVEPAKPSPHQ